MNKRFWIQAMIVIGVLLASAPLLGYAAGPGTSSQPAAGPVLTSPDGSLWKCAYQPEPATPEYYRGRAGQLERRADYRGARTTGRLVCKLVGGTE